MASENKVQIKTQISDESLGGFLGRMEEIRRSSPELFEETTAIHLSKSAPYHNRVNQILESRDRAPPKERPQAFHKFNEKLHVNLVSLVQEEKDKKNKNQKKKKRLPIMDHKEVILETIENNQVVLIRGATGCGKTTQVPQFILDSYIKQKRGTDCRIVCTQPRRVAAISIACRVAEERKEELGASVGYLIRCENELPRPQGGHILYCTVGVLLRQIQTDPTFRNLTHIIVDEIHERSSESDVLLGVLKILLPLRPDLRVIIMSATIEMDQFSEYFGNCPTLEITGLNHAVEEVYLDAIMRQINMPLNKRERRDPKIWFSFITKLIVDIHKNRPPGAILVFCSGYDEIEKLYRNLRREGDPSMRVYILHSLVPVRRDRIFRRAAEGERKIVLSTNVAESSITIDDVVYVVDNGRLKVMSFNPKSRTHTLQNSLITKANAQQRKGRAGRCQEGIVFRMYPREVYDSMEEYVRANVTRERLDSLLLDLMVWNFGPVKEFLGSLLSPPSEELIDCGLEDLMAMGAINEDQVLTKLGRILSNMHLDARLGRMLIYSAIFDVVDPITTIAAFLSYKDVFMLPLGNKKGRKELVLKNAANIDLDEELSGLMELQLDLDGDLCSDHLVRVKAVQDYIQNKGDPNYCYENYLNESTMIQVMAMRSSIIKSLTRNQFISKKHEEVAISGNSRTQNKYIHTIRSVICAGLYPNTVGLIPKEEKTKSGEVVKVNKLFTPHGRECEFHKSSVNSKKKSFDTRYFVYYQALNTHKCFLHDTTMVHSLSLCLFAYNVKYSEKNEVIVDGFFSFQYPENLIKLIKILRPAMQNIFARRVNNPQPENFKPSELKAIELIADFLAMSEKP